MNAAGNRGGFPFSGELAREGEHRRDAIYMAMRHDKLMTESRSEMCGIEGNLYRADDRDSREFSPRLCEEIPDTQAPRQNVETRSQCAAREADPPQASERPPRRQGYVFAPVLARPRETASEANEIKQRRSRRHAPDVWARWISCLRCSSPNTSCP